MVLFLALLGVCQFLTPRSQIFFLRHAEFWIYPAQTILCGALLLWFRRCYEFHRPKSVAFALLIALAVLQNFSTIVSSRITIVRPSGRGGSISGIARFQP